MYMHLTYKGNIHIYCVQYLWIYYLHIQKINLKFASKYQICAPLLELFHWYAFFEFHLYFGYYPSIGSVSDKKSWHFVGCCFAWMIVSFATVIFLSFMKSYLLIAGLKAKENCVLFSKSFPVSMSSFFFYQIQCIWFHVVHRSMNLCVCLHACFIPLLPCFPPLVCSKIWGLPLW